MLGWPLTRQCETQWADSSIRVYVFGPNYDGLSNVLLTLISNNAQTLSYLSDFFFYFSLSSLCFCIWHSKPPIILSKSLRSTKTFTRTSRIKNVVYLLVFHARSFLFKRILLHQRRKSRNLRYSSIII